MQYRAKNISLLFFLIITLFGNLSFLFANSADKPISFLWAFIIQNKAGETTTIAPEKAEVNLTGDDKFKIFIKPIENAYVYIFLLDGQGRLSLVFPEYLDFFRKGYGWGTSYHIPEGDDWLYVDEKHGTEEFYILASYDRLSKLESLVQTFITTGLLKQKDTDRIALAQKLVTDEIKRLRLEGFSAQSPPEKPIPVAGNYRGVGKRDEVLATEVKTTGFYAKTIRIVH